MKPVRSGLKIWPPIIILRYWIIQGMLFMNNVERIHRMLLEIIFFIVIFIALFNIDMHKRILLSIGIAHTFSFLFNGHLFAMMTHDLFWFGLYKKKSKFIGYMDNMYERLNAYQPEYIDGVVFFGSLARGIFRETSDLDVRFIAKKGFVNGLKASHFVFKERLRALFHGFPIDAYMFLTEKEVRKKMDVINEYPVCMLSTSNTLGQMFPELQSYGHFKKIIKNVHEIKNVH
jgi:predicted nucleotidyltransferase